MRWCQFFRKSAAYSKGTDLQTMNIQAMVVKIATTAEMMLSDNSIVVWASSR